MDLRFGDHPSFHRAAAGMALGSALLGVCLHPLTPLAPLLAGIGGFAAGTAWGYGKPALRFGFATAAAIPLVAFTPSWPVLAASAGIAGLGIAAGLRGVRGLVTVMLGAAVALCAMWAALRIGHARGTARWPSWASDTASAAAMGIVGVLAMLPRHVRVTLDAVRTSLRALPADLDGEVKDLCARAATIWAGANEQLADGDPGKKLVRDGVLKTFEVARRSAETKIIGTTDEELTRRMTDLDTRIAAATDTEVKTQYQSARAALDDQRRYRDHIRQNRERLVARMHNHVAALEKFQLAASGLAAARAASTGATVVKQLEELSQDVAASGEALAEIEIGAAPEVAPVPASA
jgi:hypothetical protein